MPRAHVQVPLARLDSLESTLASLLDFDESGNIINVDDEAAIGVTSGEPVVK